jgi:hypothetical protein
MVTMAVAPARIRRWEPDTTGIRAFAKCQPLCRVLFLGHSTKKPLPRAVLGKVLLSVTSSFTECGTLGKDMFAEWQTLGQGGARQRVVSDRLKLTAFAEGRGSTLGKEAFLPSAKYLALGKDLFTECLLWTLGKTYFF